MSSRIPPSLDDSDGSLPLTVRPKPAPEAAQLKVFGSPEAVEKWHAAWFCLHDFALASGCPLGRDVAAWLVERSAAYSAALNPPETPNDR